MKIKKMNRECWCSVCDNATAKYELSSEIDGLQDSAGSFKLFWAAGPTDPEICFCEKCFNKLKQLINEVE